MTVHEWSAVIDVTLSAVPWAIVAVVVGAWWDLARR